MYDSYLRQGRSPLSVPLLFEPIKASPSNVFQTSIVSGAPMSSAKGGFGQKCPPTLERFCPVQR